MILSVYTPTRPGCIHRQVRTGHAIPYTYLQINVWVTQDHDTGDTCMLHSNTKKDTLSPSLYYAGLSRLVARHRLASSSSLCQEVMNFFASCNSPLCHGTPSSLFAAGVHTALLTPTECKPVVHGRAIRGYERLEVVLETIQPILLRASLA